MSHKHQHPHEAGPSGQKHDQKPAEAPAPGPPAPQAPPAEEMAALRAEKDDLLRRLQRVSADYLNYQKRIQKETLQSREFANEALLKAMLPVLDDIDRALESGAAAHAEDDPLLVGLRLVKDKALAALGAFGLTAVESAGKPFDPEHHSAVSQFATAEHAPNMVVKELCKGYALKGRTIRPAMVVVSVPPQEPEKPQAEEEC
jgi:molecular chaperone GrpE